MTRQRRGAGQPGQRPGNVSEYMLRPERAQDSCSLANTTFIRYDDPAQALLVTLCLDFSGPEQITLDYRVSNNSLIDALHVAQTGAK
jgi:hypothetical protein